MRITTRFLLLALLAPLAVASSQDVPSKWSAWLGCWAPVSFTTMSATATTSATCIVPGTTGDAAELVVVREGIATQRSPLIADGERHVVAAEGCTGRETARFSDDGARVFMEAEVSCNDGPPQKTSGIFAISPGGEWIDVLGVTVAEQKTLRVRRSRVLSDLAGMPDDIRSVLSPLARASGAVRLASSMDISLERVIEASKAVDARVTEGWIVESARDADVPPPLTARDLERLAAADVPTPVIDVLVALSYPKVFQVALAADGSGEVMKLESEPGAGATDHWRYGSPLGFDPLLMRPECAYLGYGWGSTLDRLNCSSYAYGSLYGRSSGYGYGSYYGYPGYGYPVTVIVRPQPPADGEVSKGRVVKGRGYTQTNPRSGEPVHPRTESASTQSTSGSSSAGAGSSSSGSSGAAPRTAKPREP